MPKITLTRIGDDPVEVTSGGKRKITLTRVGGNTGQLQTSTEKPEKKYSWTSPRDWGSAMANSWGTAFDAAAGYTVAAVESILPGKQSGEKVAPNLGTKMYTQNPLKTAKQLAEVRRDPELNKVAGIASDIINPAIVIGAATAPKAGAIILTRAAAKGLVSKGLATAATSAAETVTAAETGQALNAGTRAAEQMLKESGVKLAKVTVPKTGIGQAIGEVEAIPFKAAAKVVKAVTPDPVKAAASKANLWIEEKFTDRFAYINKSQGRAKGAGLKISKDMDAETKISMLGGAPEAGTQIYKETLRDVEEALKKDYATQIPNEPSGTIVYRGGDSPLDYARGGGEGISVTTDKGIAEGFTDPDNPVISNAILPSGAKILREPEIPLRLQSSYIMEAKKLAELGLYEPEYVFNRLRKSVLSKQREIVNYARAKGYDAVEFPFENEIRIVKAGVLKDPAVANKPTTYAKVSMGDVNEYLKLRHAHEIFMMKGHRQFVGTYTGPADVIVRLGQLEERLGPEQMLKVKGAAKVVRDNYTAQLAKRANAGLISPETAQFFYNNYPWYNPVKYMDEAQAHFEGVSKAISNSNPGWRKLGEIGSEGEIVDPVNAMWVSNLRTEELIAKNEAAKATAKIFQADPQLAGKVKIVPEGERVWSNMGQMSYMENGKKITLEIPKEAEEAIKQLNVIPKVDTFRIAGAINAVSRAGTTTMNIAFFVPNMAVDTLTAMITSGVGPVHIGRRLAYNLKGIVKEDKVMADMLKAKGGMSGFWGKSPEELAREATKQGNLVLKGGKDWKRFFAAPIEAVQKTGHAIEMAPRTAVYEKGIGKGLTKEQAALEARRSTIDFQRSGSLIRELNSLYMYLNAGVQGSMVPFRALRDNPMARVRATGYMGIVAANYAYNRQFEEYKDVPNYYKYGAGLLFMVPSNEYDKRGNKVPHFITVIPNQREWTLFSSPVIYAMSKLDGSNPQDFEMFINDLVPRVNPLSKFTGQGGYPVPTQLGATWFSAYVMNKDPFTGKDVVPAELQNLPKEQQYDEYSSQAAIKAGSVLGMSPKKLEFFVKGVFGGVGSQFLEAVDYASSKLSPNKADPRIEEMLSKLEDIQSSSDPSQIENARNKYLYSLSEADREAVLSLERHPAERMPIITSISRKVYHEGGGQLYKTGQQIAEKKTGISASQSKQASMALAQMSGELQGSQEKIDTLFTSGEITGTQWRELRKQLGQQYQGAMAMVRLTYPQAAQSATEADWQDWLTKVYTLGGSMPDIRSRANVLVSAYRSITPEGEIGQEDWDTYFQRIADFKNGLVAEDRAMLDNELRSRMTAVERQYQDAQSKLEASGYWDVEKNVYSDWSKKPGYSNIKKLKEAWANTENQIRKDFIASGQTNTALLNQKIKQAKYQQARALMQIEPYVARAKAQWKATHPQEAMLLKLWYGG